MDALTPNLLSSMMSGEDVTGTLQVLAIKEMPQLTKKTYALTLSDGAHFVKVMLAFQHSPVVEEEQLAINSIIKVTKFLVHQTSTNASKLLILLDFEVKEKDVSSKLGDPTALPGHGNGVGVSLDEVLVDTGDGMEELAAKFSISQRNYNSLSQQNKKRSREEADSSSNGTGGGGSSSSSSPSVCSSSSSSPTPPTLLFLRRLLLTRSGQVLLVCGWHGPGGREAMEVPTVEHDDS